MGSYLYQIFWLAPCDKNRNSNFLLLYFLPRHKESLSSSDEYWIWWLICRIPRVVTISGKSCTVKVSFQPKLFKINMLSSFKIRFFRILHRGCFIHQNRAPVSLLVYTNGDGEERWMRQLFLFLFFFLSVCPYMWDIVSIILSFLIFLRARKRRRDDESRGYLLDCDRVDHG